MVSEQNENAVAAKIQEQGMTDAGRSTILSNDSHPVGEEVEALASAYLVLADDSLSLALRLAAADRASDVERHRTRVAQVQSLVSRGYARWGKPRG